MNDFKPVHHLLGFRFTVRNITVNGAQTAIYSLWNWGEAIVKMFNPLTPPGKGWTYQDVKINDCQVRLLIDYDITR